MRRYTKYWYVYDEFIFRVFAKNLIKISRVSKLSLVKINILSFFATQFALLINSCIKSNLACEKFKDIISGAHLVCALCQERVVALFQSLLRECGSIRREITSVLEPVTRIVLRTIILEKTWALVRKSAATRHLETKSRRDARFIAHLPWQLRIRRILIFSLRNNTNPKISVTQNFYIIKKSFVIWF